MINGGTKKRSNSLLPNYDFFKNTYKYVRKILNYLSGPVKFIGLSGGFKAS
jgi:hypothetical protein